ncbi:MAG TPA: hypothetical protein VJ499_02490 [Flavisolibacter sp.]|nr:hypothetical protein [Flavisolibacter sp.]
MNTLAGFACSIGVDMGYNNHHHKHEKQKRDKQGMSHHEHLHKPVINQISFNDTTKDDCCSNSVTKFNLLDKSVTDNSINWQTNSLSIIYLATFLIKTGDPGIQTVKSWFHFVRRSCSLDHTDIRIAIQSFQV